MTEEWRSVVGFEGQYEVSSHGRLRSLSTHSWGRTHMRRVPMVLCTPVDVTTGYPQARLWRNVEARRSVHRLVLEAFVGACPIGQQASHLDGGRANNRLDNLRWESCSANNMRKHQHGTAQIAERNFNSKLTRADVAEMRHLHALGENYPGLGRRFGVNRSTARRAVIGQNWAHVV